jgi:hypothetical protein
MKAEGVIYKINEIQNISEKFKKRDFVLEIKNNEAYVQKVMFTLILDKVDAINNCSVGDAVTVDYDLQGKEWTSPDGTVKFFNTLSVKGVTKVLDSTINTVTTEDLNKRVGTNPDSDDLPF